MAEHTSPTPAALEDPARRVPPLRALLPRVRRPRSRRRTRRHPRIVRPPTPRRPSPRHSQSAKPAAAARKKPPRAQVVAAVIDPDRRRALIAQAAYFRAERRHFAPGHEAEDWLAAELEVDTALTSGVALSDN
jgi:hypothetical protein